MHKGTGSWNRGVDGKGQDVSMPWKVFGFQGRGVKAPGGGHGAEMPSAPLLRSCVLLCEGYLFSFSLCFYGRGVQLDSERAGAVFWVPSPHLSHPFLGTLMGCFNRDMFPFFHFLPILFRS